ncbi:MAG TPA: hypothetical protein VFH94_00770 [Streptomyces sp.]|nr:hypothetical protein [Streptomyces sp.]
MSVKRDGLDITITLTPAEADALGQDVDLIAELLDSHLWAIGMLRSGVNSRDPGSPPPTAGDWASALKGLERLPQRLEGARGAALRALVAAEARSGRMAWALSAPGEWERWAVGGGAG